MTLKNIIALCMLLPLVAFGAKPEVIQELEIIKPVELTVEEQINYYSKLYNTDSNLVSKVIQCESKGSNTAVGDRGLSRGIAQFQKPTFLNLSKKLGEELDYTSSHDQIKLMVWSIANGYGSNWTAYRAIKNGGVYSFYSNQLKQHFTVVCR